MANAPSVLRTARAEKRHQAAIKAWNKRGRKKDRDKVKEAAGVPGAALRSQLGPAAFAKPGSQLPLRWSPAQGPAGAKGSVSVRGDWSADKFTALERKLSTTPPHEVKHLGGGVTESYKVRLEDGSKGCFKPSSGEYKSIRQGIHGGLMAEREAGAWEVAKLVGMDDMVAPVVIREVNVPGAPGRWGKAFGAGVKRGSFALWQEGEVAMDAGLKKYDGEDDFKRAAMFDYIIGNQDRHQKNWVLDSTGKMKLIDHGLSFGEDRVDPCRNSEFTDRIARWGKFAGESASVYAKRYVAAKPRILAALSKLGLPEKAIYRVGNRIDRAAAAKTWADFITDTG